MVNVREDSQGMLRDVPLEKDNSLPSTPPKQSVHPGKPLALHFQFSELLAFYLNERLPHNLASHAAAGVINQIIRLMQAERLLLQAGFAVETQSLQRTMTEAVIGLAYILHKPEERVPAALEHSLEVDIAVMVADTGMTAWLAAASAAPFAHGINMKQNDSDSGLFSAVDGVSVEDAFAGDFAVEDVYVEDVSYVELFPDTDGLTSVTVSLLQSCRLAAYSLGLALEVAGTDSSFNHTMQTELDRLSAKLAAEG